MNDRSTMTDLDRVLERVRKLLAIAQDERANPNEAAAAAHQADVIMRKYQIEHADVIARSMQAADSFESATVSTVMKRGLQGKAGEHKPTKNPAWAGWLSVAIANLHDCQARFTKTPELGACVRFSGYKADVQVAAWTFDYLANAMIMATRRYQKEATRSKDESESFRRGFVLALCAKLNAQRREKEAEMQQASSSRALVVVKAQAVSERFGAIHYREGTKVEISRGEAFRSGREQGAKVDTRRGALGSTAGSGNLRLN